MFEQAKGRETIAIGAQMQLIEKALHKTHWTLRKYKGDYPMMPDSEIQKTELPYEVIEFDGNVLLNSGINNLVTKGLIGTIVHPIDGTYGCIGVGDGTLAASATQTGLQAAANHLWVLLNAVPTLGTQTLVAAATFADAQANWVWAEACVGVANSGLPLNAADPTFALNRKVQALGTKTSGSWTLTVTLTFS